MGDIELNQVNELEDIDAQINPTNAVIGPDGQPSFFPASGQPQITDDGNPILPEDGGAEPRDEENPEGVPTEGDEPYDKFAEPGRIRRFATIMNLLNSLLGAGILGVPGSLKHIGIIPSVLLIALIAFLSHIATVLTIKLQRRCDAEGFDDLAFKTFGKIGSYSLSIMIMLFCISCCVAYLVIGTDSIKSFLSLGKISIDKAWQRALTVFLFWAVLPGLLTFPKDISFLQYFSFVNFGCVVFFVIAMIVKGIIIFPKNGLHKNLNIGSFGIGAFQAISIYGLAFALPVVVLPIIEPYNKDIHKRSTVSGWTNFLCFLLVVIPGVFGYLILGDSAGSNVLTAFDNNDVLIAVCRGAFLFVVSCSYPCLSQSLMASWSSVIFRVNCHRDLPTKKRIIVVLVSNIIPLLIAMFLPTAGPALSIGGAFGGCLADFFFPPAIWAKISKKPLYHWQNILCILFAIFGIVACAISTYLAIVEAIDAFSK